MRTISMAAVFLLLALAGPLAAGSGEGALQTASPRPAAAPRRPTAVPTPVPTPAPPPRIEETPRKGVAPRDRVPRFPSRDIVFSRILRVEEVDLDRDGVSEVLVDGIATVNRIPEDVPTVGFVSRSRLPFESPLLVVMKRFPDEWRPLFMAHVPLRCGQSDDLSQCDQLLAFRSIRFRYDDRPQVLFQMLHPGDTGLNETSTYRLNRGRLEPTFSVSLPRASVNVVVDESGIERRLAIDSFVNRELPLRYRSFTLKTRFEFGENRFRIAGEVPEDPWSKERGDTELAYWGLVHQPGFAADVERLRERQKKEPPEAWALDPVEVARRRFPDATRVRLGARAAGVAVVFFDLASGCHGHAFLFQPLREWEGEKTFWEVGMMRGQKDFPFECFEEPPLAR